MRRIFFATIILLFLTGGMLSACHKAGIEIDDGTGVRPAAAITLAGPETKAPPVSDDGKYKEKREEMCELINRYREENGQSPLETSPDLNAWAYVRAQEISVQFSHTRPNEDFFWTAEEPGINQIRAEIFARDSDSAEEVLSTFLESSAHRDILLDQGHKTIGVSLCEARDGRFYWVILLGSSESPLRMNDIHTIFFTRRIYHERDHLLLS